MSPKDVRHFAGGAEAWWAVHQDVVKAAIKCVQEMSCVKNG